jgi:glucose-1-phosphate thymidylyltransferase
MIKGIILAGGSGTRLYPLTKSVSKHLLPIYDKPMIYYPLSILMLLSIRDILIISTSKDRDAYFELLGDGSRIGVRLSYSVQDEPKGIAEAFLIGESFIGKDNVCLILGDNFFYGQDLHNILMKELNTLEGAMICAYQVKNPSSFGVVEFDNENRVISLEEKPLLPKTSFAIPGVYFYNSDVVLKAKRVTASKRGELEITSINQMYLNESKLKVIPLGRGITWLDTGSPDALLSASHFVEVIQKRQGLSIACIEEIAWRKNYITLSELENIAEGFKHTQYGEYLVNLCDRGKNNE